jgi:MEMO1 family protein
MDGQLCYKMSVEKPKVRWVEAIPMMQKGVETVLLRDMEGITENTLMVSRHTAFLLSLMDGTRTVRDLQAEFMRQFGELLYTEDIQTVIDTLDANLFLQNDAFQDHYGRLRAEYEGAPVRKSYLSGKSYPEGMGDLLRFLDEMFQAKGQPQTDGEVTGLLVPHIDYSRGTEVYQEIYPYLKTVKTPLLIILGTCHRPTERMWSISQKDFATPLGVMENPKDLCALIQENRTLSRYIDEWPHRSEHSIELQLPLIQYMAADRDVEILPILTGSMHEFTEGAKDIADGEIEDIIGNFCEVLGGYGKPYVILSAADLAHIGAQFGDTYALNRFTLDESEQKDRLILDRIGQNSAQGFLDVIRDERDRRRICGLAPIYFQLRLLEGSRCDIVSYRQWTDGKSSVSFAGGVFYRR